MDEQSNEQCSKSFKEIANRHYNWVDKRVWEEEEDVENAIEICYNIPTEGKDRKKPTNVENNLKKEKGSGGNFEKKTTQHKTQPHQTTENNN